MHPGIRGALLLMGVAVMIVSPDLLADDVDPPQVQIGERLFLETRFAEFFHRNSPTNVNAALIQGDPVMDTLVTTDATIPGPFAGHSMNCRQCHLVDEASIGNRTYADFARRSPLPDRGDGRTVTPRNSPLLVNATLPRRGGMLLHFDGEFHSPADLVKGTFTGRNFGWLPTERTQAVAQIARVIREDDGTGDLAQDYAGLPYRVLLKGADQSIPAELRLPPRFRVNVDKASDERILNEVAKLVAAYVESLVFSLDDTGAFNGSPYDVFFQKNNLPRRPGKRESNLDYARHLRSLIEALSSPQFVTEADGSFQLHDQSFVFGAKELAGLKVFLAEPSGLPPTAGEISAGGIGNCLACHAPPDFTDFRFHNTGVAQSEYDSLHGQGAFNALAVPTLKERSANYDAYLPPTAKHPYALGPFLAVPSADDPKLTDLGLWNVCANPDQKRSQARIRRALRATFGGLRRGEMLDKTIGLFKTPGLRDLADSAPYFHTGQFDTLNSVVGFYRAIGTAARAGIVRNADLQLSGVALKSEDLDALVAFLMSLTEDYD
ncbi:MAG TPA: hypothetical protein VLZ12_08705 [Verrucomicrobiae bacterium]|nr:hypothetical protein [Verrucomicrobiae bacterium]